MTALAAALSSILCLAGAVFFVAGTLGLLRFPDVYTRLHALTKADNLGLGLIALGVALQAASWLIALKVILVWILAMVASAAACNLIAAAAIRSQPDTTLADAE
ncbi:MAG: monovalent cation/H(+) antiporter subunit G [Planctomycetota bacterium]